MELKNQYLKYEEYRYLGGTLGQTPFNILELEARKQIDKYTSGRLVNLDEQKNEVKVCVYRLIPLLENYNRLSNLDKSKTGEGIDGYSVSYAGASENAPKAKTSEIKEIIKSELSECYLDDGTPYLYVGV